MQVNCIAKLMQLENELRAAQESCLFLTVKYAVTTEARAINLGLIGGPESRQRLVEMDALLGFRGVIEKLELARWREGRLDGAAAASAVSELAKQVKQLRERVEKGKAEAKDKKDEKKSDAKKTDEVVPLKVAPQVRLQLRSKGRGIGGV